MRLVVALVLAITAGPVIAFDAGSSLGAAPASVREKRPLYLRDATIGRDDAFPAVPAGYRQREGGALWIVHFEGPSRPAWRQALTGRGASLLFYLPDDAHVVRLPGGPAALAGLTMVARVEAFHPWYRIAPDLRTRIAGDDDRGSFSPESRARLRVLLADRTEATRARFERAVAALGAERANDARGSRIVDVFLNLEGLPRLAALDEVVWIEPWSAPELDMDLVRQDSGANAVESATSLCGSGVRGEVLDSGLYWTHPDFDGILLHGLVDGGFHGTNTYGIVFGNGRRDTPADGDALATGLLPCAGSQGIAADFDYVDDYFNHARELKQAPYFAAFQTNSWGHALTTHYNLHSFEVDDIVWRLDLAMGRSQGNNKNRYSRPEAWGKNTIAVGGVNHQNTLALDDDCWCGTAGSIGPAEDGRIKPDLVYWYDDVYTTNGSSSYGDFTGTSASTPTAMGVVGLIAGLWAEGTWPVHLSGTTVYDRLPHASTLKALAVNSAVPYTFSGEDHDLSRDKQGWGRPNADEARRRAARSFVIDESHPLTLGESRTFPVSVAQGEESLRVTMVYTDPPGAPFATRHRVNDLDLRVVAPDGTTTYYGNVGLRESLWSAPGGSPNSVDTVENVFVQNPAPGMWQITISAPEINEDAHLPTASDDAAFALVVTGATGTTCTPPDVDFTIAPAVTTIGTPVTFTSSASGGAGAPYSYSWDFDRFDSPGSTEPNPVHVFDSAWAGNVTLLVRDAAGCLGRAVHPVTIGGPDLRFASFGGLVEVEGNGNGMLDPGETWDLTVDMKNWGDETASGVSAEIVPAPDNPGPIAILAGTSAYPDIAAGEMASSQSAYRIRLGTTFPCGRNVSLSLRSVRSTLPATSYAAAESVIGILVGGSGPREVVWRDGFETDLGWTESGSVSGLAAAQWETGPPQGLGTPLPDPPAAFAGSNVLGNDLSGQGATPGNYEPSTNARRTSPLIDVTRFRALELSYQQWLNLSAPDTARVSVSGNGGATAETLVSHKGNAETAWSAHSFPISPDYESSLDFVVVFSIAVGTSSTQAAGWNIDEVEITGVPLDSCTPIERGLPGEATELRVTRAAGETLSLSWTADCGSGTAYAVYRGNLTEGLASAAPENCDVDGTSITIPAGTESAEFFLVAPHDGVFEGSLGWGVDGDSRPPPASTCHPRDAVSDCVN